MPILFSFFVMGFCDVVGISTTYVKNDFNLSEALAGLVLAQTTRRGAKFIYGSSSTAMDLRYGAAVVGTPELAVLNAGVAAMARYYKLPSWAAGG